MLIGYGHRRRTPNWTAPTGVIYIKVGRTTGDIYVAVTKVGGSESHFRRLGVDFAIPQARHHTGVAEAVARQQVELIWPVGQVARHGGGPGGEKPSYYRG